MIRHPRQKVPNEAKAIKRRPSASVMSPFACCKCLRIRLFFLMNSYFANRWIGDAVLARSTCRHLPFPLDISCLFCWAPYFADVASSALPSPTSNHDLSIFAAVLACTCTFL